MAWQDIWWHQETQRIRSGWRVCLFFCLAMLLAVLFVGVLALSAHLAGIRIDPKSTVTNLLLSTLATIPAFILAGVWAVRALDHLPAGTLGLSPVGPWCPALVLGFCQGVAMIGLVVLLLCLFNLADVRIGAIGREDGLRLLAMLGIMLLAAAQAEVIFRGYMYQTLLRSIGPLPALLLTSTAFGVFGAHPQDHPIGLMNTIGIGIMLGLLYLRMGALWGPIGLGAGWTFAQFLFHAPLPGFDMAATTPLVISFHGPAWITGGTFGIGGGAAGSVVVLGMIAILAYTRRGLPLASRWWEWNALQAPVQLPPSWDFTIDGRYYQWKLLVRDQAE